MRLRDRLTLGIALLVASCGDNKQVEFVVDAKPDIDSTVALAFVAEPTFSFPSTNAPLSGRIVLETNRPTRVALHIVSADRSYDVERPILTTSHSVPVLELRAETHHQIVVSVTDASGEMLSSAPIDVTAPAVPATAPTFTTEEILPAQTEPGVTLAAMRDYVFAIDRDGAYVWFVDLQRPTSDITPLPSGNFLVPFLNNRAAVEIDAFGSTVREWHASNAAPTGSAISVALDSFHHELLPTNSGDFLTLSTERRQLADYPTSETDPTPRVQPVTVVGDVVAVFAADGTLRETHSLLDVLDPYRVAYDSFSSFWSTFYADDTLDWSHGNSVIRDPSDNGFVVSLRHQDALVKLDPDGDLRWILGTPDNWKSSFAPFLLAPTGTPFAFPFHQHAPKILANGNILVFDNGNYRVSPPATGPLPTYSRAVEFSVDPGAKQVRQVWEYDAARSIFAIATGDVDVGPTTGNVIVTFGVTGKLVEVTHTTPPIEVFRMQTSGRFYRTQRVPSLYRN